VSRELVYSYTLGGTHFLSLFVLSLPQCLEGNHISCTGIRACRAVKGRSGPDTRKGGIAPMSLFVGSVVPLAVLEYHTKQEEEATNRDNISTAV